MHMPIEIKTLQVYFAYLINALRVRALRRGRRQADNPFPPIPATTCRPGRFVIHRHPSRWNF
jgi:hypothetical protein